VNVVRLDVLSLASASRGTSAWRKFCFFSIAPATNQFPVLWRARGVVMIDSWPGCGCRWWKVFRRLQCQRLASLGSGRWLDSTEVSGAVISAGAGAGAARGGMMPPDCPAVAFYTPVGFEPVSDRSAAIPRSCRHPRRRGRK